MWCKIQQATPPATLDPTDVEDVREVHGIRPSYAAKLEAAGVTSGTDFASQSASDIAEIAGVRETTAAEWLAQFDPTHDPAPDIQLGYRYIRDKILQRTMEEARIDKPANPHYYRHSRASFLANHLKETQLCEWFGWVQGSDVPAKYVHLSGRDLDDAYDGLHGTPSAADETEVGRLEVCPRCEWENEHNIKYCGRCGRNLVEDQPVANQDVVPIEEVVELQQTTIQSLEGFGIDPEDVGELEEINDALADWRAQNIELSNPQTPDH